MGNLASDDLVVSIANNMGQVVYQHNYGNPHDFFARTIKIDGWPAGMYNVSIKQGNISTTQKLMVF
jgi:hypothetical protein